MGIKASREELKGLLSGDDDATDALTSYQPNGAARAKPATPPATPAANAAIVPATRPAGADPNTPPQPVPTPDLPPPPTTPHTRAPWRSQGLTIYESDDEIIDGFLDHMRKQKLKVGRKKGFSLFARAGLRALAELLENDPNAFEAMLVRALKEQEVPPAT